MRRRTSVLGGVGVLVALAAGGPVALRLRRHPPAAPAPVTPSVATVDVHRTDLADSRLVAGTLGFGAARDVRGSGTGVLTRLPKVGAAVTRGTRLFRVDDQPVVVLYGDTPMFRVIDKVGMTGNDVRELRRNLDQLGYWSAVAKNSDTVDQPMLDSLRKWQESLGVTGPGALRPAQVVVVAGPGRVSELVAENGTPADTVVLKMTGTTKVVSVPMSAGDAHEIKLGVRVTVELPDGGSAPATVTAISRSVVADPNSGEPPKLIVTVTPTRAKDVASFDSAPVQVRFTTAARRNVLVVPVGALVALHEGGYAVQLPDGTLVAARTGAFAGGLVEVSGAGLTEGMTVVTTS
ncbi:hypothetical protein ACIG87_03455 [Micromonospora sp. NPDC051925]|uniref:hypothetical protein n=1 Tax=Micromonospora sp. NPDC051925 TaxID=3364288 RepID=UPI0037C8732E